MTALETYNFDNPTRRRSLRAQLHALELVRDAIVMPLGEEDRRRWMEALTPLATKIEAELALQEGTGRMVDVVEVFGRMEGAA